MIEFFQFDLQGKISGANQYGRPIVK
jgi:hypothetical protein